MEIGLYSNRATPTNPSCSFGLLGNHPSAAFDPANMAVSKSGALPR